MALSDNCLMYRKLDETTWTSAADASGNSKTGTVSNGTWWTGKINNWLAFNGSTTWVATSNVLTWTTDFSIAAWIKTSTVNGRIVNQREANWQFFIFCVGWTWYLWYLDYNAWFKNNHVSNTLLTDWQRHHVWVTRVWTAITFYHNWAADWGWTGTQCVSLQNYYLNVWYDIQDWGWVRFNGTMDEIAVWNRALSASERSTLYNWWSWLQYPFSSTSNTTNFFQMF